MKRCLGVSAEAGILGSLVFGRPATAHARGAESADHELGQLDTDHDGQVSRDEPTKTGGAPDTNTRF
jgi:hypothetical protein